VEHAHSDLLEDAAVGKPPRARDSTWFSPLFVLAPARSNSTVVAAMLGMHPQLWGFPELALFRRGKVSELLEDPAGWRGARAELRLAGLLRAIAQVHAGEQTEEGIAAARAWLADRREWPVELILDHLLAGVAPLVGVEKSPESVSHDSYLARLATAYPRARFLHLTRHPIASVTSMHRHWSELGYWEISPELFHQFCVGVWFHQHARIDRLVASLPPDRALQVRSEDVLREPQTSLPQICRWLGIDAGAEAIDSMCHPERSPHARLGPPSAPGGGDAGFLRDPVLRAPSEPPGSLELPADWIVDPWRWLSTVELARRLGYDAAP
jgi:hypothetical protein